MSWRRDIGYHGDAPVFEMDDPLLDPLFRSTGRTGAARRNREAPFREGPIETMKDISSWDEANLRKMDKTSVVLTEKFQDSTDSAGRVGANAVRSNFLGLRHIPGLPMIPATFPLADNTHKREAAGLADGPINPKHELIFRATVRLFFSGLENQGLKIARGSSTGCPEFQKSMTAKLTTAVAALANAEAAGQLYLYGKFEEAFLLYDFGGCYYVVYREQMSDKVSYLQTGDKVDKSHFVSKDRKVAPVEFAISGGRKGDMITASKDPQRLADMGFFIPEGFFCTRRRTAMACPFTSNAPIMVIAQAVRARIYDEYAYSFHHTTRLNKQEKVAAWDFCIATDVSDHDTFWPGWLLDLICDELAQMGFADWWIEILRTTMRLPVYVSAPAPDQGHILIGDWREPRMNVGLPSGIGITDLMGTMLMAPCYAIMQLDHTAPGLWDRVRDMPSACSFLDSYYKGKEAIAQMSKSDDALLGWSAGPAALAGRDLQERMMAGDEDLSPYMKISYEHGGAFLGDVLVYDHTKELSSARFMGNVISYVVNMFCPEYSVDSKQPVREKRARPFAGLAVEAAPAVFGTAPHFDDINDVLEEIHYDFYHESYKQKRALILEEDKSALAEWVRTRSSFESLGSLSSMDHEVLADPSKLWWKFDIQKINPAVVELVSSGLSRDQTELFFNSVTRNVR